MTDHRPLSAAPIAKAGSPAGPDLAPAARRAPACARSFAPPAPAYGRWRRTARHGLMLALGLLASAGASAQVGLAQWQPAGQARPVTLVYPTEAAAAPLEIGAFSIDVAVDAAPRSGRHPLVVMSHGSGGSPVADHALAATLARAGLVVAQPLHDGDNYQDQRLSGPASFQRRPGELSAVIDALAADPAWAPRLDLERVGVHGMSAGGVSALSLAGAQWRTLDLVRHCNAEREADEGFCFQGAADPAKRAARAARFDRARGWPDFVLPAELKTLHGGMSPGDGRTDPRPDPRVASVSVAVPVVAIFSTESLARIQAPVGVVSARDDQVLLPRFHSQRLLGHCNSCTPLATLPGGHFDVLAPWPDSVARTVAASQPRGGLPTPGFDPALRSAAHEAIARFHREHLRPAAGTGSPSVPQ